MLERVGPRYHALDAHMPHGPHALVGTSSDLFRSDGRPNGIGPWHWRTLVFPTEQTRRPGRETGTAGSTAVVLGCFYVRCQVPGGAEPPAKRPRLKAEGTAWHSTLQVVGRSVFVLLDCAVCGFLWGPLWGAAWSRAFSDLARA